MQHGAANALSLKTFNYNHNHLFTLTFWKYFS